MSSNNFSNVTPIRRNNAEMPVIRISDDHAERLELLAVQMTVKNQKVITTAEALKQLLEERLPKREGPTKPTKKGQ